jgi:5-methylcytosine-specific restriction protein A
MAMASWPYTTQRWQRLRRMKLAVNPLCEPCLKQRRIVPAGAVDHIVAISSGGDPYPALEDLMSCCASCHNRKTRIVEQMGKKLTVKGCDEFGYPLDPNHPWNRER